MVLTPRDSNDLAEIVRERTKPLAVEGLGSKSALGHAVNADKLSLAKFSGVAMYEPEELVLEAGASTPFADIQKLVAKHHQHLAFDPPDYSKILRVNHSGSIGSMLMCNLSGSRRLTAGAARDHILGISGVSGRGEIFKGGGRVVKNVTGYDMPKLMAGSFGTLAAITSVTFKVLPRPETETTVIVPCTDILEAGAMMRLAMQLPVDVSAAAYDPARGVVLRLEGIASSVADRKTRLTETLKRDSADVSAEQSKLVWASIRDCDALRAENDDVIWRISVAPTEGPALAMQLQQQLSARILLDWSGGLVWAAVPPEHASKNIRTMLNEGHAMLFRAGDEIKNKIGVFHPQAEHLRMLAQRVKTSFDPNSIFNPGRMYRS